MRLWITVSVERQVRYDGGVLSASQMSVREMIRANTIRTIVRIICRIAQMISVLRELSWVNQIIVNLIFFCIPII